MVDVGVAVVDNGDVDHAKDPSLCYVAVRQSKLKVATVYKLVLMEVTNYH